MKISITKALAVGGLFALFAGVAGIATAQGNGTPGMHQDHMAMHHSYMTTHHGYMATHHPRRHIKRLQAAYARDIASGHRKAAERAHLKARAVRQHVRTHREMMHDGMTHHTMLHHDMMHHTMPH